MEHGLAQSLGGAMSDMTFAQAFGDAKWSNKRQTKSLGNRDIEGIKAEGKMSSYEIPAGEIGNANAIVVTDENWVSLDLQITVYSKHSDPRSGDRIYRVSNLKREEAAASLFTVPADYKLRDVAQEIKDLKIEQFEKMEKLPKADKK
jgi:hypothetical protein